MCSRLRYLYEYMYCIMCSQLVRYVTEWEDFLNIATMVLRVVNLVLFIVLLAHWNACLQFLVPMLKEFPADSWVVQEELQHAAKLEQYTWSLFKAMSHMLCIGYGRFPPQGAADVWITMASMLTGAVCYAMFVGQATA